jgi:hypothetical protein
MRKAFRHTLARMQIGLSFALLLAFAAETLAAIAVPVIVFGGAVGWVSGVILGGVVANATRRPVGTLLARLIDFRV